MKGALETDRFRIGNGIALKWGNCDGWRERGGASDDGNGVRGDCVIQNNIFCTVFNQQQGFCRLPVMWTTEW